MGAAGTALAGALLALAVPAAARAEVRVAGHGWGHGVGLAQYGAQGYAAREGRGFRWILGHYYPGTTLRAWPPARVRVLLDRARALTVCSATRARDARGRTLRLSAARAYRLAPWRTDGLVLADRATGTPRRHLQAPVRVTGGTSTCLRGVALNGRRDGRYRGVLRLLRDGPRIAVVDDVALRHYLHAVVPSEMPSTWAAGALRAQAVAARTYALRSLRPAEPYDVLPDTTAQVYGGMDAETARTTAAVRATEPLVATYGGVLAATFFSAGSGGRTAAVEEIWPAATPVPYLRSVDDPYDRLSPYHDWTVALDDTTAARRLDGVLAGGLVDLQVVARTPSGRAAVVRVTGTEGTQDVPAGDIRRLLGLRSTWFDVAVRDN